MLSKTTNHRPWDRMAPYALVLLVAHVYLLILARIFLNVDEINNWDLIPFLNANTFDSFWRLLQQPEVHFLNPFSFPLYNTGPESVFSAILFRLLGKVSLYWSNAAVQLLYATAFLFALYKLLRLVFPDVKQQSVAWALLAMSPVLLTFTATSAFNTQAYLVIVMGMCGIELVLDRRVVTGVALLAMSFLLISQAYPIAFFLPFYLTAWLFWRLSYAALGDRAAPDAKGNRSLVVSALIGLITITVLSLAVNYASDGTFFSKISPLNPHGKGDVFGSITELLSRLELFARQAINPEIRVDDVPVGFAPYFIFLTAVLYACLMLLDKLLSPAGRKRRTHSAPAWIKTAIFIVVSLGLVVFGYLPGFLDPIVKSQRVLMGDVFLVVVIVAICSRINWRRYPRTVGLLVLMPLLLAVSDAYYLYFVSSTDHSRNHYPVFDFDLSDSKVRHDLIGAIVAMKAQVEDERVVLVVEYPRAYTENTTDPGLFYAHFLRHFGRFEPSENLILPFHWCDVRYGCPFPSIANEPCAREGCYHPPEAAIESAIGAGRKVFLWQWQDIRAEPKITVDSAVPAAARVTELAMEPPLTDWRVFEIVAQADQAMTHDGADDTPATDDRQ